MPQVGSTYTPDNNGEATLGPLNPLRSVGLLLLRGNDVPAKLGRFPNGNVPAAPDAKGMPWKPDQGRRRTCRRRSVPLRRASH